jgi:peptidoglycan/xylan/chitin deacetylase (PgdA/CDA1 family)
MRWIKDGERLGSKIGHHRILKGMATALHLELDEVLKQNRFMLMDAREVGLLGSNFGWEVQLHTHRHVLPASSMEAMMHEITENKSRLEAWTGRTCTEFCYPSGMYEPQHPGWLRAAGIHSATTCDAGLNDSDTNRMLLKRYLDHENWSDLQFEAAMSGFSDFLARFLFVTGLPKWRNRRRRAG